MYVQGRRNNRRDLIPIEFEYIGDSTIRLILDSETLELYDNYSAPDRKITFEFELYSGK